MTKKEALRITELYYRLSEYGFTDKEVDAMRRISHTLTRWCEMECNGEIERDESTGKPMRVFACNWLRSSYPIPDRDAGAIRRMKRIMASHPGWAWYYQTDPRGCSVYLYRTDDDRLSQYPIESIYSSIGIAIY